MKIFHISNVHIIMKIRKILYYEDLKPYNIFCVPGTEVIIMNLLTANLHYGMVVVSCNQTASFLLYGAGIFRPHTKEKSGLAMRD